MSAFMTRDIHQIQRLVAIASGLTVLDLCSARRERRLARTRQLAMWLCRRLTPHSLPAIGREFGDRDHSTVMHALAVIDRLMAEDMDFARRVTCFAQFVDYEQHNGRVAA